jgi:phosphoribosylformylglycinamidine synthase
MEFTAKVFVTLKEEVNDPQGRTVLQGLKRLGFESIHSVRVGKYLVLQLEAQDAKVAEIEAVKMCQQLLVNPVIESSNIEITKH